MDGLTKSRTEQRQICATTLFNIARSAPGVDLDIPTGEHAPPIRELTSRDIDHGPIRSNKVVQPPPRRMVNEVVQALIRRTLLRLSSVECRVADILHRKINAAQVKTHQYMAKEKRSRPSTYKVSYDDDLSALLDQIAHSLVDELVEVVLEHEPGVVGFIGTIPAHIQATAMTNTVRSAYMSKAVLMKDYAVRWGLTG